MYCIVRPANSEHMHVGIQPQAQDIFLVDIVK